MMNKYVRIALVWVATFAILAAVFFFFADPYKAAIKESFALWSMEQLLSMGVVLGAITLTGSIYSKK